MNHIIFHVINRAYLTMLRGTVAQTPPNPAIFSLSLSFSSFPPFSFSLPFPPFISPLPSPLPHLHHFLSAPSSLEAPLSFSLTHKVCLDSLKCHYSCQITIYDVFVPAILLHFLKDYYLQYSFFRKT